MPKVSKGKKARLNNLSKATEALTLKRSQTNTPIPEGTPEGTPLELDSPTQTFPELEPTSLDDAPGSWDSLLGDELPDKAEHRLEQEAGRKRKRKESRPTQTSDDLSLEVQGRLQRQPQSPHPAKKLQRFPQTLRMTLR
ncbi:hypothetical protein C8R44DRAFT_775592, partial [Mycena epipterygia]